MSYTICTFHRISPRKLKLADKRENLNAAQLGGVIAHALDDCDVFQVHDDVIGTVMTYDKRGVR